MRVVSGVVGLVLAGQAFAAPPTAVRWPGIYLERTSNGYERVIVKDGGRGGGRYDVDVKRFTSRCVGGLGGVGLVRGNELVVTMPRESEAFDTCRFRLRPTAGGMVGDADGCIDYAGAGCTLSAKLKRVG